MSKVQKVLMNEKKIATIQAKFQDARDVMYDSLIERDTEIDIVLTSMICQENPLLVGAPGTAKSMLLASLAQWMQCDYFDYLLTKYTDPMELFGPIDLQALKDGKVERIVDGMLPDTTFAFLDELFKASSAILNCLLKVLNERTFKYGAQEIKCPLLFCVAASNEWPNDQEGGKELGALFDRFLLRRNVEAINTQAGRSKLLRVRTHTPQFNDTITRDEVMYANQASKLLVWDPETWTKMDTILDALKIDGIRVGDRRMYKSVDAVSAFAFLNGRDVVTPDDLEILSHILWEDPVDQPKKCAKIVAQIANPSSMLISQKLVEIEDVISKNSPEQAVPKLKDIRKQLEAVKESVRRNQVIEHLNKLIKKTYNKVIGVHEQ